MNDEAKTLFAAGALLGLLIWYFKRCLVAAWLRRKREHKANAERLAACREGSERERVLSENYRALSELRRKRAERLEKENIELQDKFRQATGDIGFTLPRNSSIAMVIQSEIEGLDKIGERIGELDIGEENRERLRYEIERLAETLTNILKEFSGGGTGSEDSEDDFGAARGLEIGSGGTPSEQAAAPDQSGTLPSETPRPSDDNPSVGPQDVRKKRRRRGRDDHKGR